MRKGLVSLIVFAIISAPCLAKEKAPIKRASALPSGMVDEPGKVAQEPAQAKRVENMTEAELEARLAEYEAGKRDARDGYIILNQLWFNHQLHKTADSAEGQRVKRLREALLQEHPDFGHMTDFRLSEKIRHDSERRSAETTQKKNAKRFTPADSRVFRLIGHGDKVAAIYQYRIEFFKLPPGTEAEVQANEPNLRLVRDGQEVQLRGPAKTVHFSAPIRAAAGRSPDREAVFVCTNLLAGYSPSSPDEHAAMEREGLGRDFTWNNPDGQYKDFCGAFDLDGKVLAKVDISQSVPGSVLEPVRVSDDGKTVTLILGEKVIERSDEHPSVGYAREAIVWTFPNKISRYKRGSAPAGTEQILDRYPKRKK